MPANIDTILANARAHTEEVIKPEVDSWNESGVWPRAASDKAAALGLTGLYAPEEFGGQGLPLGEGIRVYEELGKGDGAAAAGRLRSGQQRVGSDVCCDGAPAGPGRPRHGCGTTAVMCRS